MDGKGNACFCSFNYPHTAPNSWSLIDQKAQYTPALRHQCSPSFFGESARDPFATHDAGNHKTCANQSNIISNHKHTYVYIYKGHIMPRSLVMQIQHPTSKTHTHTKKQKQTLKFLDVFGSLKPFFGSYNRVFLYRLDLYGRCDFPKWSVYGRSCWRRKRQRKLRKRRRLLWAAMFFRLRQGQSPQRKKIYIEYIHKYLIWLIKAYCPENRNWEIKAESSLFSLGIPVMTLFCEPQSVGTQRKICGRILLDSRPLCLRHLAWSGKKQSSS